MNYGKFRMIRVLETSAVKSELATSGVQTIVLHGPQCAGKTTLARKLPEFEYISLGQTVRSYADDNPLKQQADHLIRQAKPLPPELGLQFIASSVKDNLSDGRKILIDGYPRKADEYITISEWLDAEGLPSIDMFVEVTAKRSILLARYAARGKRGVENQEFFDLRYRQYMKFREYIGSLATRRIVYDTSEIT